MHRSAASEHELLSLLGIHQPDLKFIPFGKLFHDCFDSVGGRLPVRESNSHLRTFRHPKYEKDLHPAKIRPYDPFSWWPGAR